jgi:hypothetical protein
MESQTPEGALSLSFTKELTSGAYVIIQAVPGAERYGSVKTTTGSLCFIALDGESKIIDPARPLGVFSVR